MITTINEAWAWAGFEAKQILLINDFGNVIFESTDNEYWRICPEELKCEKIADSEANYRTLLSDAGFVEDWEMLNLVRIAEESVGELRDAEKYCLKLPGILGGEYKAENIGKISLMELIKYSGYLAKQIKDSPNGTNFKLSIIE